MTAAFADASPAWLLSALGWGLLLVAAFVGWGGALSRLLGAKEEGDAGMRGALGLALTVAAGGLFNLLSWISRAGLLLFLAAGIGSLLVDLLARRRKDPPPASVREGGPAGLLLSGAVFLCSALLFAGSVDGKVFTSSEYRDFDPHDDEQAYLVFPLKMLDTGGMGNDPFDARRLNVLGGQSLLHAFVAVLFPARTTHLLDGGVGLLLSLLVVRGAARRRGFSKTAAALPLLVLLLLPSAAARGNTTSLFTGVALLAAAYRLVEEEPFGETGRLRGAIPLGLVAAGAAALKTTLLPAIVLFLVFDVLLGFGRKEGAARLRGAFAAGAFGALFLFPWMLSVKLSSGTFLFPLLGRGFQGEIPWDRIPGIPAEAFASAPGRFALAGKSLLPFLPLALLVPAAWAARRRTAPVAFGLAVFLVPLVLRFAGDPHLDRSLWRYVFPAYAAALALLFLESLSGVRTRWAAALVAAGAVAAGAPLAGGGYRQALSNVASAVSHRPLVDPDLASRAASLLSSVPPGAAVLTRLPHPWLLDPAAHRLLLISMPGWSSPPPGMRFFEGAEPLARYLAGAGIRYLAYGDRGDGSTLLLLGEAEIRYRYPLSRSRWAILSFHRDFHRNVRELSFTRARLADRRDAVVLDLGERALRLPVLEAPERLSGFTKDGRTSGEALVRLDYGRGEKDRFLRVVLPGEGSAAGLRAAVDGAPLPVARHEAGAAVFDLAGAPARLGTLALDGPGVEVAGVATVARADEAPAVGPSAQRVEGALEVAAAEWRSGFYPDDWTDGDGVLSNLDWKPAAGETELAVELGAWPPGPPEAADVRVLVNGIELSRLAVKEGVWRFRLPGADSIRRIRILSKTFVPKEAGQNDDTRRLGVAVARVRIGTGMP